MLQPAGLGDISPVLLAASERLSTKVCIIAEMFGWPPLVRTSAGVGMIGVAPTKVSLTTEPAGPSGRNAERPLENAARHAVGALGVNSDIRTSGWNLFSFCGRSPSPSTCLANTRPPGNVPPVHRNPTELVKYAARDPARELIAGRNSSLCNHPR